MSYTVKEYKRTKQKEDFSIRLKGDKKEITQELNNLLKYWQNKGFITFLKIEQNSKMPQKSIKLDKDNNNIITMCEFKTIINIDIRSQQNQTIVKYQWGIRKDIFKTTKEHF